jgi:predicted phosphodiesterase
MRKWRPSHKSLYVIPEIHGNIKSLEVILNRILPLRIFENQEDVIVFLGDYVDGDNDGNMVLNALISIKEQYKDRVIMIRGNHDEMMLRAILGTDSDFNYWISNGGISTIEGYLSKTNLSGNAHSIKRNRLQDVIPKNHIEFLKTLEPYYIFEDYCFFHGGFDPSKSIKESSFTNIFFDNTSSKYVKSCILNKEEPIFKDNYIYVGAHNYQGTNPVIYKNYFMLGGSAPNKLFVFDLNSMEACAVARGKSRIYTANFRIFE